MTSILTRSDFKNILVGSLLVGCIFTLSACFEDANTPLENAAQGVSEGVENVAEELDPNRTAGERIGDAVENAGETIQDTAAQ